jgi:putative ABC transport system ATP-binding protein
MRGLGLLRARRQAAEILDQVQMSHRLHLRPGQLSTGECQRVAIARALANEPEVLFADEPTAALDAENGLAVMERLSELVRLRRLTLVVVTHDYRIFPYSDRILRLEAGVVQEEVCELGLQMRQGRDGAAAAERKEKAA